MSGRSKQQGNEYTEGTILERGRLSYKQVILEDSVLRPHGHPNDKAVIGSVFNLVKNLH